jgi:ubiquitin-like 1-activating enzyme E1 A
MTNSNGNNDDKSSITTATGTGTGSATPTESDVYDRQIRLWGAESQAKMSQARVLYIHVTGINSEICKNLVLAGIAATLCDTRSMESVATTPSIFLPPPTKKTKYATVAQAVQPFIQELNPLLGDCPLLEKDVSELTQEDVQDFSVVIASQIPANLATKLAAWSQKFYMCDCFGMAGACLLDLGAGYEYRPEQGKTLLDARPVDTHVTLEQLMQVPLEHAVNRFHKQPPPTFVQYRCLLEYANQKGSWPSEETSDEFLQVVETFVNADTHPTLLNHPALTKEALVTLARQAKSEVAPICSVLGGIIGNEIIKVVSGKGEPANNTLLLDGTTCKAWTFLVQPKKA